MYTYIHMYIYIHTYIHTHIYVCVCTYTHMYACILCTCRLYMHSLTLDQKGKICVADRENARVQVFTIGMYITTHI